MRDPTKREVDAATSTEGKTTADEPAPQREERDPKFKPPPRPAKIKAVLAEVAAVALALVIEYEVAYDYGYESRASSLAGRSSPGSSDPTGGIVIDRGKRRARIETSTAAMMIEDAAGLLRASDTALAKGLGDRNAALAAEYGKGKRCFCGRPAVAKGLCARDYQRRRRADAAKKVAEDI